MNFGKEDERSIIAEEISAFRNSDSNTGPTTDLIDKFNS
jgi:hypothetical protein